MLKKVSEGLILFAIEYQNYKNHFLRCMAFLFKSIPAQKKHGYKKRFKNVFEGKNVEKNTFSCFINLSKN